MIGRLGSVAERLVFCFLAKQRPDDQFAAVFFDLREKAKALKEEWSQKAKTALTKDLKAWLAEAGHEVESVEISLGKYKGSRFVTSAKVRVKMPSEEKAKGFVGKLAKWSPKYIFKSYDAERKIAEYNIR